MSQIDQTPDSCANGLAKIAWPIPIEETKAPVWTDDGFRLDGRLLSILQTAVTQSGWNKDLATLMATENSPDRPIGKASRRNVIRALRRHRGAESGRIVLEVGCSNGYTLDAIRSDFPDALLIGCDYEPQPLMDLAERISGLPLVQLDITQPVLPDSICDTIIMLNVLEHIEDDLAALKQVNRMLNPDGLLIVEVPAGPECYNDFDRLVGHFRRYTMANLTQRLTRSGFTIIEQCHIGALAYPAFRLHKFLGTARHRERNNAQAVLRTIRAGRKSTLQDLIFRLDEAIRNLAPLPFGIRCFVVARRE